jgi:hypothetical protein
MSVLASVEVQLVLRCLDVQSRLAAACCSKQLFAAATHPFAWPQDQLMTLRVPNDAAALQALGAQVRSSLLRLSAIDLRLRPTTSILGPEVFAVPHVHAIRAPHTASRFRWNLPDSFLPLLCHPQAQQLRSLDISNLCDHQCSPAELQQLASLPHLHSLSLGGALRSELDSNSNVNVSAALQRLSLFPSLTHLSINVSNEEPQDYASLWECTRLNSLGLEFATVNTELVNCLARLPLLQRLQLAWCSVEEHEAQAWTALRSLREIQLNSRCEPEQLLPLLSAIPMLRLIRCRWLAPRAVPRPSSSPDSCHDRNSPPLLELLGPLLVASPSLQVELLLPLRFAEWRYLTALRHDTLLHTHALREGKAPPCPQHASLLPFPPLPLCHGLPAPLPLAHAALLPHIAPPHDTPRCVTTHCCTHMHCAKGRLLPARSMPPFFPSLPCLSATGCLLLPSRPAVCLSSAFASQGARRQKGKQGIASNEGR